MKARWPASGGRQVKGRGPEAGALALLGRLWWLKAFFLILFLAVFAKAFKLQVVDAEALRKEASSQHKTIMTVKSKRGGIYDRNNEEMAVSVEVDSVYAHPGKIVSPVSAARALAPMLHMDTRAIERLIGAEDKGFVWIKRQVELSDKQREAIDSIGGLGVVKESRRYYPNSVLASNLIGFTGIDSNGLEGVELHYDGMLKGKATRLVGERDARGAVMLYEDVDKTVPIEGMEVELTIDRTIQYIAEKALRKAVDNSGARGGTAVVMDPSTGEILAMAMYPSFDPNDFKSYGRGSWRNRVVTDAYEPGSLLKLFIIAAALEERAIGARDSFYCENGSYKVADRVFHDTKKHGWLSVTQIIGSSSNIGAAKIGEKLGKEEVYRYLSAFGFGSKTGVDLPGEASGSLRHFKNWSGVTLHTVSFGQGVATTDLQLISALSAIANKGFLMKPYTVKVVRDSAGEAASRTAPTIVRRVVSEETANRISRMMMSVVEPGGTGERAAIDGIGVAGKTGTAQKADLVNGGYEKGAYIATFFGFAPVSKPRLSILVTIDEPRGEEYYGGQVAAPAFKDIATESLAYLGVLPSAPKAAVVAKDGTQGDEKAGASVQSAVAGLEPDQAAMPDFTGMPLRAVLGQAARMDLDVTISGSGRAVSQKPAPGEALPRSRKAAVWFR